MITSSQDRTLIMMGHCLVIINEALGLLSRAYENRNYAIFYAYKEIEVFLNIPKDKIDLGSYFKYR